MQITLDGITYDVIIERKNNKNTYLRVKEDLNIYVTTSYLTPNFMIEKLIKDNIPFIEKQIDKMGKRIDKKEKNYILGEEISIEINKNIKRTSFDGKTLYVKNKSDIEKWYKKATKKIFEKHLNDVYNRFTVDIPFPKLCIRKMTTRWGVNNSRLKKVTLNSELIYKDPKYLDYVIVHELAHFIHHNHGKGFWKLVEENEPNYKRLRKELQE
jgi:predicted metal-dependent hydrolase